MNSTLQIIFETFWTFCGFLILFAVVASLLNNFIFLCWNRFWRHYTLRKLGYPPAHCDADGDFLGGSSISKTEAKELQRDLQAISQQLHQAIDNNAKLLETVMYLGTRLEKLEQKKP